MEKVSDKIFELLDKHPAAFVIVGGDFNVFVSDNKQELHLTDYTKANSSTCEVMDAFRSMEADGGIHMEQAAVLFETGLRVCVELLGIQNHNKSSKLLVRSCFIICGNAH